MGSIGDLGIEVEGMANHGQPSCGHFEECALPP
jgi:hypothetical protein